MRIELLLQPEERNRVYQGLQIDFDKIELETLDVMEDDFCPFVCLDYNVSFEQYKGESRLTGDLHTIMRNQKENSRFGLFFKHKLTARGSKDYTKAQTVLIAYQFIFDWIKEYIEKENITDKEGNTFLIPSFSYASPHFELP